MSAVTNPQTKIMSAPLAAPRSVAVPRTPASVFARALDLLSSVRFGVALLVLLAAACMVGMLIMQVNVEGFAKYYAELSPSQKLLYGSFGFFDIYHSWYFDAMLVVLSLNIVLSSIERFPGAWTYVSRKKLDASAHWLRGQEQHAALSVEGGDACEVAARVSAACESLKLKARVTETFCQLDQPQTATVALPFEVECTDIQQKLIDKSGPTSPTNTLDWLTSIRIKDPGYGETEAVVRMNRPFDYRGYRFFQASFVPEGKARQILLRVTPEGEGAQPQDI